MNSSAFSSATRSSSVRTSEVNIIATEAPPPMLSSEAIFCAGLTTADNNGNVQQHQQHPTAVLPLISQPLIDGSLEHLSSTLNAFENLRSTSYLSEEDFTADIIAVAFGTFDTKLGNNIDYHYPHTHGTDGTNSAIAPPASASSSPSSSSTAFCSIDFNKLNELYKLQDFAFPDGSHDSFVDTIPFVISSTGSVQKVSERRPSGATHAAKSKASGGEEDTYYTSTSPAAAFPIFGFACYHLFKDPTVHRGAVQRSFLVLTRRPMFHCLRRVARQTFVPFFDAVPSTDIASHRRFVRCVYESLAIAMGPFSTSLRHLAADEDESTVAKEAVETPSRTEGGKVEINLDEVEDEITVGKGVRREEEEGEKPTSGASADSEEYRFQMSNRRSAVERLALTQFCAPEEALRDVRYFSLVFNWPEEPRKKRSRVGSPSSPSSGVTTNANVSPRAPTSGGGLTGTTSAVISPRINAVSSSSTLPPPLPFDPLNPEQLRNDVPIASALLNVTRERAATLQQATMSAGCCPTSTSPASLPQSRRQSTIAGGNTFRPPSGGTTGVTVAAAAGGRSSVAASPAPQEDSASQRQQQPTTDNAAVAAASTQLASAFVHAISTAVTGAAHSVLHTAAKVLSAEEKPVGGGLASCEVEVSAPSNPSENDKSAHLEPGKSHYTNTDASSNQQQQQLRPPLRLNVHFPLLLPRSDCSFIQQMALGTSVKTLLRWFGAEKLATIHYCMLARYPILFVGQHADQVSSAVMASAHLLSPFTASGCGGGSSNGCMSGPNSVASFSGGNGSAGSNSAEHLGNNNASHHAGSAGGNKIGTASSSAASLQMHNPSHPLNAAAQLDPCAFLPYATLDMMDRVLEVVSSPTYENICHPTTSAAVDAMANNNTASAPTTPPSPSPAVGGNGVGYYVAVGATNVFIVNRDVKGMLKCNVNDGSVSFSSNSSVKKLLGGSKGLAELKKVWQTAALAHLNDKFVRECYYRLLVCKINLGIKAECDARLHGGVHFKALMGGGGVEPTSGGDGPIVSIFEKVHQQQHLVTTDASFDGFLMIDDTEKRGNSHTSNDGGGVEGYAGNGNGGVAVKQQQLTSADLATTDEEANGGARTASPRARAATTTGISVAAAGPLGSGSSNTVSPNNAAATQSNIYGGAGGVSRVASMAALQQQQPAAGSSSLHVEYSSALSNFLHLAQKNRRLLAETDGWYQRLIAALQKTVAAESGEELVALGAELASFSAVEEAVMGPDLSVELCPSRALDACAYQEITDRDVRLRAIADFRQRSFCFIDALTRGNHRALARRSNLYVSDFFLANVVGAEVYNLPQQVVLFQCDCQQVIYANRIKYKTSGTVYLTRNFLLFQAAKLTLYKRHQIIPLDLIRGVSKYSKGLVFENASVRMMVDMVPSRAKEEQQRKNGWGGGKQRSGGAKAAGAMPNLFVDKKSMNDTTALVSYTNMGSTANHEMFFEILLGLYLKQKSIVEHMRDVPCVHTIPDGVRDDQSSLTTTSESSSPPNRMLTTAGIEMVCPVWIPRGLYSTANTIVVDEVWENQRLYPLIGWKSRLLPSDPPSFSDFSCLRELSIDVTAQAKNGNNKASTDANAAIESIAAKKSERRGSSTSVIEKCPIDGFEWIDSEWRMACDLTEAELVKGATTTRGGGGGANDDDDDDLDIALPSASSPQPLIFVPPTTDKLLATNRGAHKILDKTENKFDQGFLYGFGSQWTAADAFRTHECAGGVIRRRLWVRRRRLIVNPEVELYNKWLELEREFACADEQPPREEDNGTKGPTSVNSENTTKKEHFDPHASLVIVVTEPPLAQEQQQQRQTTTRTRTGRNLPPPPSAALLKKFNSLALADGLSIHAPEGISGHADSSIFLSPNSSVAALHSGARFNAASPIGGSSPLTAANVWRVPDSQSPSWRRGGAKKRRAAGGVNLDDDDDDGAYSDSTDSTDIIDPSEVDESLTAPVSEQNDDGGAMAAGKNSAVSFFGGFGGGGGSNSSNNAEAERRARVDAEAILPPQWEGQRKNRFDRDELL